MQCSVCHKSGTTGTYGLTKHHGWICADCEMTEVKESRRLLADYPTFVETLRKDPNLLLAESTLHKLNLNHAVIGICGEAGEIADAVKKHTIYNQPLDQARLKHIIEELGDMEFYLQQLRNALYLTRDDCLKANMLKLSERYKNLVYSNEAARMRLDKAAEQQQAGDTTL